MAERLKPVNVVTVGVGMTGGIMGKELAAAGLTVVGLERGAMRDTVPDFQSPAAHDELRFAIRKALMQDNVKEAVRCSPRSPRPMSRPIGRSRREKTADMLLLPIAFRRSHHNLIVATAPVAVTSDLRRAVQEPERRSPRIVELSAFCRACRQSGNRAIGAAQRPRLGRQKFTSAFGEMARRRSSRCSSGNTPLSRRWKSAPTSENKLRWSSHGRDTH